MALIAQQFFADDFTIMFGIGAIDALYGDREHAIFGSSYPFAVTLTGALLALRGPLGDLCSTSLTSSAHVRLLRLAASNEAVEASVSYLVLPEIMRPTAVN